MATTGGKYRRMNDKDRIVMVSESRLETLIRDSERLAVVTDIAWSESYHALDAIKLICGKECVPWAKA